jgi:signal transduction histidine kinase
MNPEGDIDAIRRSLGLTLEEEERVRKAGRRLAGEVEGWVEAFYVRLLADPLAVPHLADPGTVVRVKHALVAWIEELLSLPYDSAYERARAEVGRVHVRIGLPIHMMVSAMGSLRRMMGASVRRAFASDAAEAARTADALDKALDLELALMLGAYRRHARELDQRTDRSLYVRHAESRAARARSDAADAGACYLALLRRAEGRPEAARWAGRLGRALEAVARTSARPAGDVPRQPPRPVRLADLAADAVKAVSVPAATAVDLVVEPPDATVVAYETPLRLAAEELLQNALNRDPGGSVRLALTALADAGLVLEVADGGTSWPEGVHTVEEAVAVAGGLPVTFSEVVVDLHGGAIELVRPPGGGAAIRIRLGPVTAEAHAP